jgi:hypothetical protein
MPSLNSFKILFTLLISTIVIVSLWTISVNAQASLTENSKLAINGIEPIRVGMTVDEAFTGCWSQAGFCSERA